MSLYFRRALVPSYLQAARVDYRLPDGRRFGPKMAADGGRIFQSSSRDVSLIIKKKGLTPEQVEDYYRRGIITKWIESPREFRKTRVVDHEVKSGWDRWTSRRVGLLGKKVGMRREVDLWGNVHPVTLIQIQANQVLQIKSPDDHQSADVWSLQVGAGLAKWHNLSKSVIGHLAKVDADPKEKIVEFRVTPDALLPSGTQLLITHFVAGQFVDCTSTSKAKGTAGVVKLHGFGGGRASHGASRDLRRPGSIASGNTSPARVFRGHPMAGRMGGERITQRNLQVMKINTVDNILYVRGAVPGHAGTWVEVRDSIKKPHKLPPPFPTHLPGEQENRPIPKRKYLRLKYADPYEKQRETDWEARWNEARAALKSAQAGEGEEGEEGEEDESLL